MKEFDLKTVFPKIYNFLDAKSWSPLSSLSWTSSKPLAGRWNIPRRFFRISFSLRWSPYLQKHVDVPSEHPPSRHHGTTTLDKAEGLLVHKNAVSLSALLLLTFPLVQDTCPNSSARLVTSGLFSQLMKLLPKDCRTTVRLNPHEQDPRVAEVIVVASVVQPCSALQVICPQSPRLEIARSRVPARRQQLLQALLQLAEVNAILVVHVLNAISFTMELSLSRSTAVPGEISTALAVMQVLFSGPHVKALASSLGKNVYDTTRWCKPLKLRMATNACPKQRRERARYVQGTQEVTARGHTWATAPDATRFSGRDWHCSTIVSVDPQLWAWMVPVALL